MENYHYLYPSRGNDALHLCQMDRYLYYTSGNCVIVSKLPMGNVPFSPPLLCEMHHGRQHICGKCIIVCTSPVSIASIFPTNLWEIHLASTVPVDNASLFLPYLWEMCHFLHLSYGKCIMISTPSVRNAS